MELILFFVGGGIYYILEVLWRGKSHWTMFVLGGICFVIIGLLNEYKFQWKDSLFDQALIGALVITTFEFISGCVINLWLKWNIWDYSNLPFNLFGQICLYFFLLWIPLSAIGVVLDDWIRYLTYCILQWIFPTIQMKERERPHYILYVHINSDEKS